MSEAYSGLGGKVFVGAVDADVSDWSLDLDNNDTDTTTTADEGWDDSTPGSSNASGTFNFFYNKNKKPTKAPGVGGGLGLRQGSIVDLVLFVNETDDEKFQGKALIKKISIKSVVKGVVSATATWKNKGPWLSPGDTFPD